MSKSSTTIRAVATPNRVTTHPGDVLNEEFLKPLGMSVNALAIALRVPATRIGAIVKEERAVTADTALRLARFFNTSPEVLDELTGPARSHENANGKWRSNRTRCATPSCLIHDASGQIPQLIQTEKFYCRAENYNLAEQGN